MVYQSTIFKRFLDYLVPGICYLCRGAAQGQKIICADCETDLPRIKTACQNCGKPQNQDSICLHCRLYPFPVDQVIAPYYYGYPVNTLVRQLKYDQKIILAKELGQAIAKRIMKVGAPLPECILPIPLHRLRYISRGFNQAVEVANSIARELSVPVDNHLLYRHKNTLAQFDLDAVARKQNIRDAFTLKTDPLYEHVAVVDDVITTGATVNEAARVLKRAGVRRVAAWACARADHATA